MSGDREVEANRASDYRYIIHIINFLEYNFAIRFPISTRDFDILYRWWEKQIPLQLVEESLATVVHRRRAQGRIIRGFSTFSYEIRKNHSRLLQYRTGRATPSDNSAAEDRWKGFLENLPAELKPLKSIFQEVMKRKQAGTSADVNRFEETLLTHFRHDRELKVKTDLFMKQLATELRTDEIRRTYQVNHLIHRFGIPEL